MRCVEEGQQTVTNEEVQQFQFFSTNNFVDFEIYLYRTMQLKWNPIKSNSMN